MIRHLIILFLFILTFSGCKPSRLSIKPGEYDNPDSTIAHLEKQLLNDIQGTWTYAIKNDGVATVEINGNKWSELRTGHPVTETVSELRLSYSWSADDTITMSPILIIDNQYFNNMFELLEVSTTTLKLEEIPSQEYLVFTRKK